MMSEKDAKKKVSALMVVVLLLIAVIGLAGLVSAKYVKETGGEGFFRAKNFYFTSNLLTERGEKYTLSTDADSIAFTLGNNADLLRFTEDNIEYTVTVSNGGALDVSSGTLIGGKISTSTVTLSNLEEGKVYTVETTGVTKNTEGRVVYSQTLKATFTVADGKTIYKHLQKDASGAFVILTVWSNNVAGDVTIETDNSIVGLIPDSTDAVLADVKNFTNGGYQPLEFTDSENFDEPYAGKTYRFFLDTAVLDAKNLSVNNFDVTMPYGNNKTYVATPDTP